MLERILSLSKQIKLIGFVTLAIFISSCAPQQRETSIGPSIDIKKPVQVALLLPKSHPKTQTLSTSLENATLMAVGDLKNVQIHLRIYDTAGSNSPKRPFKHKKLLMTAPKLSLVPYLVKLQTLLAWP